MIIALCILIGIFVVALCVLTVIYKIRFREATNDTGDNIVIMPSYDRFMSLYNLAPEKYSLHSKYYHSVHYRTDVTETRCKGTPFEYCIELYKYYDIYFEDPADYVRVWLMFKKRERKEHDEKVQKNSIQAQKEFIEHVRKDLEAFEKEGAVMKGGETL